MAGEKFAPSLPGGVGVRAGPQAKLDKYELDRLRAGQISRLAQTRKILTAPTGTHLTPTNCIALLVRLWGGGGGGAGATGTADPKYSVGGGGASGGYAEALIVLPAVSYPFGCGSAGAAGIAANGNGGMGGDTIFGAFKAKGGGGGYSSGAVSTLVFASGGINQPGGIGDIVGGGTNGSPGFADGLNNYNGAGGSSLVGVGGSIIGAPGSGLDGTGNASGGSGALSLNATGHPGGAGKPGIIIVDEFY